MIRTSLGVLLALAWVLATSHCRIAALHGFEFLECATEVHEAGEAGHDSDPCDEAGCCAFETVQHHAQRQVDVPLMVLQEVLPPGDLEVSDRTLPEEVSLGVLTAAPPEIGRSWQFFSRTALPVRAPSFVG